MSHKESETPSSRHPDNSETAEAGSERKTGRGTATQQTTGGRAATSLRDFFVTPASTETNAAALSEEGDSAKTSESETDYTLPSPRPHQSPRTLRREDDGDSQNSNPTEDTGDESLEISQLGEQYEERTLRKVELQVSAKMEERLEARFKTFSAQNEERLTKMEERLNAQFEKYFKMFSQPKLSNSMTPEFTPTDIQPSQVLKGLQADTEIRNRFKVNY